ncbi:hypothetical protein BJV77DRAFT_451737 [Russula vinacea]|nr:hypothetical protein BJV77DRAFT_451737 [Russula vinacea]
MSHPPMFGTFTISVDGSSDLCRGPDTLQQRHDSRCPLTPTTEDMMTNFSDDTFHHLPAPSARLAFSPALDTSESTISPTFSNFSPSTSSGYSIPSPDSAAVSTPSDADDAWNLIPYNVSWGHEYEEYRAGILPGPEGDCVFLRSPTPLRNQRASEACKKCRERKAKCTGTRPSCARCASRDYICEYASESPSDSSSANATTTTTTTKARRPSRRETREGPAILTQLHKGSSPPSPGNHPGPIIVPSLRQRYPSSSHSTTTPTTRAHHIGKAPRRAMTVRWRSRGNSTTMRACSRIPRTIRIPLQDSGHHRSLPRIRSVAFLTVTTPGLSH